MSYSQPAGARSWYKQHFRSICRNPAYASEIPGCLPDTSVVFQPTTVVLSSSVATADHSVHTGLTIRQAAAIWGCSYGTMRDLVCSNVIESYPVRPGSKHRRIARASLDAARQRLTNQSVSEDHNSGQRLSNLNGRDFLDTLFS